ncbi:serine protease [Hansschlegelia quercus]|nr:serine protease [Hansschlegelia quercus]
MPLKPITVRTCEAIARGEAGLPALPENGQTSALFDYEDPMGARWAVFPVFRQGEDGRLTGLGTAFALDPWGALMSAHHVFAEMERWVPLAAAAVEAGPAGAPRYTMEAPADRGFRVLLGVGLVFGRPRVPEGGLAPITRYAWLGLPGDDPLAALRGEPDVRPLDLVMMEARIHAERRLECLPLRRSPVGPRPGETVLAIGFPEISAFEGDRAEAVVVGARMKAAYGEVVALYLEGRGGVRGTPIFEVQADWPGGMSGGPVLNLRGEVVGVVSRSIAAANGGELGTGVATWIEPLHQHLSAYAPTLHPDDPLARLAPCIHSGDDIAGLFRDEASARAEAERLGADYAVSQCIVRADAVGFPQLFAARP